MRFDTTISIKEIAVKINAKLVGNEELMITGMNEIHKVEKGNLLFVDHPKYYDKVLNSAGSAILIDKEVKVPGGKAILICDDPFGAYNSLAHEFNPVQAISSMIASDAKIGPGSIIEKGVVIASNVQIGENCHIQAGSYIGKDTIIGDNTVIQPNATLGSDAFYFNRKPDGYKQWRSVGRVVIGSNVFIGSSTTINRGVSGDTIVGDGTKIDCLVQLGHGVVVGKDCLLASQVGIGGKSIVGDNVIMYGQVGVAQRINIADNVVILAKSGVSKDLEEGKTYFGYPAAEARDKYRELASLRNLPEFMRRKG